MESSMKPNVGTVDRFLRLAVGLVLVSLAIAGAIGPWGYIGVLPLLTGLFSYCPAYKVFGIDSCAGHAGGTRSTR
jgi:hypothetical protein